METLAQVSTDGILFPAHIRATLIKNGCAQSFDDELFRELFTGAGGTGEQSSSKDRFHDDRRSFSAAGCRETLNHPLGRLFPEPSWLKAIDLSAD